jgi:methanogenic corrinoid protein MtbC1
MDREAGVSTRDTFATPRPGGARRQSRAESAPQYTGAMPAPLTFPATRVDDGVVTAAERDEYLHVVLGGDDAAAAAFVTALRARGAEVSAIYLGLLGPTAERLGQLWDDDACDFFDVTIATGRLQRAVRDLGHDFVGGGEAGAAGGRVLLSAMPGEQHTLGLFMVAEYLLRDGWGVRVSTPATSAELAGIMRDHAFDVVGFSAGCDSRLLAMRHEIAGVRRNSRNAHVCVIVGGRIFVDHPELVARVGADGSAASAADASRCARALVSARMA